MKKLAIILMFACAGSQDVTSSTSDEVSARSVCSPAARCNDWQCERTAIGTVCTDGSALVDAGCAMDCGDFSAFCPLRPNLFRSCEHGCMSPGNRAPGETFDDCLYTCMTNLSRDQQCQIGIEP